VIEKVQDPFSMKISCDAYKMENANRERCKCPQAVKYFYVAGIRFNGILRGHERKN
jgi:hypothetical protein